MKEVELINKKGMYITYTKSNKFESIFKPKNYKTKINKEFTKFGITEKDFKSRKKCYTDNFGEDIVFIPIPVSEGINLKALEKEILKMLKLKYQRAGRAREWFHTTDRSYIISLIKGVILQSC